MSGGDHDTQPAIIIIAELTTVGNHMVQLYTLTQVFKTGNVLWVKTAFCF